MNRLGLENYTELLDEDMSFQPSDSIVIYTSKRSGGIAIGLGPATYPTPQQQNGNSSLGASAAHADPAIILARKSVNPQDMAPGANTAVNGNAAGAGDVSAFKSPLPLPTTHSGSVFNVNGSSAGHGPINGVQLQQSGMPLPSSPALHPVPSPFPPSTIATPLPGHGPPRAGSDAVMMQQMPVFWHLPPGSQPMPRSAHASPAPPAYGAAPGVMGHPQMPAGQPGAPPQVGGPGARQQHPMESTPATAAPPPPPPNVAQSLAEQLVSLVRQRMNSVSQQGTAPEAGRQTPALSPDAIKMQRDYCRKWLVGVIQADDELVDAFARRFPPPIFDRQQQAPQ
ncbi:hypothetical protein GGF46_001131 [Coemansia sp. RSA 552]|nr:hypothetical protein GGF46_001131 [Coemansia sp. RSA 552]